jgi:predicted nucleotidyltransferase
LSSRLPEIVKLKISAERFLKVLRQLNIDYVMIGGIPAGFYGQPRFTEDLDFTADPVAVAERFVELVHKLEQKGFILTSSRPTREKLKSIVSLRFVDERNRTLIDLVLHPRGFIWNPEILKRRREERLLTRSMKIWCVPLEDLIVMKIANGEPQDLKDLEKIVSRRFDEIDWGYLSRRAQKFGLKKEVDEIHKRFSIT